jgi:hypothetical protein
MSRAPSSKQDKPTAKPATKTAKPAAKSATKSSAAPEVKVEAVVAKVAKKAAKKAEIAPAPTIKAAKDDKKAKAKKTADKKPEPIRECFFTFPDADYDRLSVLKQRALVAGQKVKKSELLRAGLASLAGMADDAFLQALDGLGKPR